jgi:hypothetical protein
LGDDQSELHQIPLNSLSERLAAHWRGNFQR